MRVSLVVNRYPVLSQTFITTQFEGLRAMGIDCRIFDKAIDPRVGAARQADLEHVDRLKVISRATYSVELVLTTAALSLRQAPGQVHNIRALGKRPRRLLGSHWLTFNRLRAVAPDVIHYAFASYAIGEEHLGNALGVPLVVSCRGYDLTHTGLQDERYYDRLWRSADFVHFRSKDLLRLALARGFNEATPHQVTPPGIDATFFSPADPPRDAPDESSVRPKRIISVGRLVPKKGHDAGLHAVAELVREGRNVVYELIGSGNEEARLRQLANELGLNQVVLFRGELAQAAVRDRLREADVLLHPSFQEGFGVAVLEAQSTGVPVVCTDAEGLRDNVEHGGTGFVVERGDIAAMAARLDDVLENPGRAKRLGAAGRRRVLSEFTVQQEIASYIESYHKALALKQQNHSRPRSERGDPRR